MITWSEKIGDDVNSRDCACSGTVTQHYHQLSVTWIAGACELHSLKGCWHVIHPERSSCLPLMKVWGWWSLFPELYSLDIGTFFFYWLCALWHMYSDFIDCCLTVIKDWNLSIFISSIIVILRDRQAWTRMYCYGQSLVAKIQCGITLGWLF